MQQRNANNSGGNNKKKRKVYQKRTDKVYLTGIITETLPGTKFIVKVERPGGKDPMMINCSVKTFFKVKRIRIIKGDAVEVEIDPERDLDPENNKATGTIIKRML